MKRFGKLTLVFGALLVLFAGCNITYEDGSTVFGCTLTTSSSGYVKYYVESVPGTYLSEGYLDSYCRPMEDGRHAVAKFKITGSRFTVGLYEGQSLRTGTCIYVYESDIVGSTKTLVGDITVTKTDRKYTLEYTQY